MTQERWRQLSGNLDLSLTEAEMKEGWHFCFEFDGLLVKGNPDKDVCDEDCWKYERD